MVKGDQSTSTTLLLDIRYVKLIALSVLIVTTSTTPNPKNEDADGDGDVVLLYVPVVMDNVTSLYFFGFPSILRRHPEGGRDLKLSHRLRLRLRFYAKSW